MNRSGWMSGAKALAASTALACVAMVASTAAQADLYTYTYTSNVMGGGFFDNNFSGTFVATITGIGTQLSTSGSVPINNAVGTAGGTTINGNTLVAPGPISAISGSFNLGNGVGSFNSTVTLTYSGIPGAQIAAGAVGPVTGTSTSFSFGSAGQGLFSAVYSGPSGGGGGSGGAPTPEVNAGLGILIAGASFAFLRRKRGGRHEAIAA